MKKISEKDFNSRFQTYLRQKLRMKEMDKDADVLIPPNFEIYESTSPNIERNKIKPKPGK